MTPHPAHEAVPRPAREGAWERLATFPERHRRALIATALRRGLLEAASIQFVLLPVLAFISAARPAEGYWLVLAAATWLVWAWPVWRVVRVVRSSFLLPDALAGAFDRLNPEAPDIFRTARDVGLRAESTPETRAALEQLFRDWESRLRRPAVPVVGTGHRRAMALCALFALAAPFVSGDARGLWRRMAMPLQVRSEIPVPRLQPLDLPAALVRGDSLVVRVRTLNVPKGRAVYAEVSAPDMMHKKSVSDGGATGGLRETRHLLVRDEALGVATLRLGPVTTPLTIRFTTRDAATSRSRIPLLEPPRLRAFSAIVTPPAYTRLPADTFAEAPSGLAVLPGTRIVWRAIAERPLAELTAMWTAAGDGTGTVDSVWSSPMPRAGEAFVLSATVRAPRTLSLRLRERGPSRDILATEGPWRLELRPDQPPAITLLEPVEDGRLAATLRVGLRFRSEDDFGVTRLVVHAILRDAEGQERRRVRRDVTHDPGFVRGTSAGERVGVWEGATLRPEPGEVIELQLEAFDNDLISGPKSARSRVVRLTLPTAEATRALVEAAAQSASEELAVARERERRLDRLRRESAGTATETRTDVLPEAGEWDVRRVLVDAPRAHLQALQRALAATSESSDPALRRAVAALEKKLPSAEVARAPVAAQQRALEALQRDQRELERALAHAQRQAEAARDRHADGKTEGKTEGKAKGKKDEASAMRQTARREAASPQEAAARAYRESSEELSRNIKEQNELRAWLQERERREAAQAARREAARRQAAQRDEEVRAALGNLEKALQAGIESGTLTPDMVEKMDRVRELLQEALEPDEAERLQRQADDAAPDAEALRRAARELSERPADFGRELERALTMLEAMRDARALRELAASARALERDQRDLATSLGDSSEAPTSAAGKEEAARAERTQQALEARLEALESRLNALEKREEAASPETTASDASQQAASQTPESPQTPQSPQNASRTPDGSPSSPRPARDAARQEARTDARKALREARPAMQQSRRALDREKPDRRTARQAATRAADRLRQAAQNLERAAPASAEASGAAAVRELLEETLAFARWLEPGALPARDPGPGSFEPGDEQAAARIASWLAGRMRALAATRPFDADVLLREATSLAAQADASSVSPHGLKRHARGAARELLKWLNQSEDGEDGNGDKEGEGQGDTSLGGGEQGQSGQEGSEGTLAERMRGVSGRQMAANRMTQELLRSMLSSRRPDAPSEPGGDPGQAPGSGRGDLSRREGGGMGSGQGTRPGSGTDNAGTGEGENGTGGEERGGSDPGGEADGGAESGSTGAAGAQQDVASLLETLAEEADDVGGAARTLRRLAEEARALERELRGVPRDPAGLRQRQERFRTRLLEASDALEERGHERERRAEIYRGGLRASHEASGGVSDSLAARLRRQRDEVRRLPLSPEQKRRLEWYYERLLAP